MRQQRWLGWCLFGFCWIAVLLLLAAGAFRSDAVVLSTHAIGYLLIPVLTALPTWWLLRRGRPSTEVDASDQSPTCWSTAIDACSEDSEVHSD